MNKRIIWAALTGLMVPYVGTLAWTGTIRGEELRYEQQKEVSGRRRILLDRTGGSYYMDMEEYDKIQNIYKRLVRQENVVLTCERELGQLRQDLLLCTGVFQGKRRKELEGRNSSAFLLNRAKKLL